MEGICRCVPHHCGPYSWLLKLGLEPSGLEIVQDFAWGGGHWVRGGGLRSGPSALLLGNGEGQGLPSAH